MAKLGPIKAKLKTKRPILNARATPTTTTTTTASEQRKKDQRLIHY